MNARELLNHFDFNGFTSPWRETILRALSLLAAAEANDGSTPEVDACANGDKYEIYPLARTLERERSGLAAEVVRLRGLLRSISDKWALHGISEALRASIDAAIDVERT